MGHLHEALHQPRVVSFPFGPRVYKRPRLHDPITWTPEPLSPCEYEMHRGDPHPDPLPVGEGRVVPRYQDMSRDGPAFLILTGS
jgi:hypothetical protein